MFKTSLRPAARLTALLGGLALTSLLVAPAGFAASGIPPARPSGDAPTAAATWRIYLDREFLDTSGLPTSGLAADASALALTISGGAGTHTCTLSADGSALECDYPDSGYRVRRGGTYSVSASGVPSGITLDGLGLFATGTYSPGAQCTPNHGGSVDPCRHMVSLRAKTATTTPPRPSKPAPPAAKPSVAPAATTAADLDAMFVVTASASNGAGRVKVVYGCAGPATRSGKSAISAAWATRDTFAITTDQATSVEHEWSSGAECTATVENAGGGALVAVSGGAPIYDDHGALIGVRTTLADGPNPVGLVFKFATGAAGSSDRSDATLPVTGSEKSASDAPNTTGTETTTRVDQLEPASSVDVPQSDDGNTVLIFAGVGILICGVLATLLVRHARRQPSAQES